MPRLRSSHAVAVAALGAALSGCAGGSARHPLAGRLKPVRNEAAYWIYTDDNWLHVRVTPGERGHRFQGSVTAVKGSLGALELERAGMAEEVAAQGDSIQFDLEPAKNTDEGFRVRVDKGCLRFDLYVDGNHHPEKIRMGRRRLAPRSIPFERCP